MSKPRRGDIVHVVWTDIEHHSHGWQGVREIEKDKPNQYEAVGWVIRWGRNRVKLAPAVTTNRRRRVSAGCHWQFPRGVILSVRVLNRPGRSGD